MDLSPSKKQCNFDCVYCELHKSAPMDSMEEVLPPAQILQAIAEALQAHKNIDVLTFTATGEPTLYPHLRELITSAKPLLPAHIKTLILSNGSRFAQAHDALLLFDMVKFSIDAALAKEFRKIDRPSRALDLPAMLAAIERFAREYRGELIAEVLLVEGHNDTRENLEAIAAFLRRVRVARVDIGSIDRPSAYQVRAVSDAKLAWASGFFTGLNVSLPTRAKIASENPASKNLADENRAGGNLANENLAREDLTNENPANKTHAQNSKTPESKSANVAKIDSNKPNSDKLDSALDFVLDSSGAKSKLSDSSASESISINSTCASESVKAKSSKPISAPESSHSKASLSESALSESSLPEPKSYDASELCKLIATRPIECGEARILFDKRTLEILDSLVRDKKLTIKKQGAHAFYTAKR